VTARALYPDHARRRPSAGNAFALLLGALILAGAAGCSLTPPRTAAPPRTSPAAPARLPPPPPDLSAVPDAVPRIEPRARFGNPPVYEVMGQRYAVLPSASGYLERGVASWYGPDFHGVATSTGEPYDMYAMTAAHKTLPLPSYVRVTNLANGRSVVVRVNDRGPFIGNRIIDLSYTAALKLGMVRDGTAFVEVRALDPEAPRVAAESLAVSVSTPAPSRAAGAAAPATALYVQAGAFASQSNAERLVERLRAAGLGSAYVAPKARAERTLYRVRLGPVASVDEFDRTVAELSTLGIRDARLAVD